MKTPEEIALIGGGILLSSGLVFGLKSGAASELPNVEHSVGTVLQGNSSTNQESAQQQQADKFNDGFQQAQKKGWQTGQWGTAKFYVDDNENMHVGSGQLNTPYSKVVDYTKVKTINFDGAAQAPQDSTDLLAPYDGEDNSKSALIQINNLSKLDTSQVTNMNGIFSGDEKLQGLDLSHFNTSHVTDMESAFYDMPSLSRLDLSHFDTSNATNMYDMFDNDSSLSSLDVSHFNTSNVNNMEFMFENDSSLSTLDLSHFDTSKVTNMDNMFYGDDIHQLTLGSDTKLQNNSNNGEYDVELSGTYQNGSQTLTANQLMDGNAHPGTWYKQ